MNFMRGEKTGLGKNQNHRYIKGYSKLSSIQHYPFIKCLFSMTDYFLNYVSLQVLICQMKLYF